MTEESVNRLLRLCILSVCLLAVSTPTLFSTTVSADEDLVLYTEYSQYDNNETLKYFIVGTNNSTYQVFLFHRDSDAPLVIAYARTGENSTRANGSIGLYEIENFGWLTLRARNETNNESAETRFRLVASPIWWEGEVDRLIADADARYNLSLYLIFAATMTLVVLLAVGVLKYRDKMMKATGDLTVAEQLIISSPWDYKGYCNDIAEENPQAQSERVHLKFKMVWWRLRDLLALKTKMKPYEDMEKEIKELKSIMPGLIQDVIVEKEAAGILVDGQWERMTANEKGEFLLPGEKRKLLSD